MMPSFEQMKALEYVGFGALGGLIGAMAKSRRLQLPRVLSERESDGATVKIIDPGFLVAPLLGSCLAYYFDTKPENAIAWGLAAGFAGPSILNAIIDPILRKFGLSTDVDPLKRQLPPTQDPL